MILVVSHFQQFRPINDPRVRYSKNLGLMYGDNFLASHNLKYFASEIHPYVSKHVNNSRILPNWIYVCL